MFMWMRSSRVWLERLAVNVVLGSIPASSETVESDGLQMKQCWITYKKIPQKSSFKMFMVTYCLWQGARSWDAEARHQLSWRTWWWRRSSSPASGGLASDSWGRSLTPQPHKWHLSPTTDTSAPQLTPQLHNWHFGPKIDTSVLKLTPQPHNWHFSPTNDTSAPQLTPQPHNWHLGPYTNN